MPNFNTLKRKPLWRVLELVLILIFVVFAVPAAKRALFPDPMTRYEKILNNSSFQGCILHVEHPRDTLILLTISSGSASSITAEIYRDAVQEQKSADGDLGIMAHSVNRNEDGSFYLTLTRIQTDGDLKRARHLEVLFCERLKNKDDQMRFSDARPAIECDVPVRETVCSATD